MDRHVRWLRRRIITSVATQTAATFAVVALVLFVILSVITDAGLVGVIFTSVVIAQLVALLRLALSMRSNPLNYSFMKKSVEEPFAHQVSRFQGVDEAHAVASNLPGFAPVATIRHAEGKSGPVFDVYHDPSRLVAASVSRSGALSLLSSLKGGRLLVTSAAALPPHERRVMNVALEGSVDGIIASHRVALSKQDDVVKLDESAHQVVLDSLALEYASFAQLGPALSSFLDLESSGRSWRVTAQVNADELAELPAQLGSSGTDVGSSAVPAPSVDLDELTDVTRITYAATQQDPPATTQVVEAETGESLVIPEVIAPQIDATVVAAPEVIAPQIDATVVAAPEVIAPQIDATVVAAPETTSLDSPAPSSGLSPDGVEAAAVAPAPMVAEESAAPAIVVPTSPVSGPTPFVTVEPDTLDDSDQVEPITTEVPAVVFTEDSALSADLTAEEGPADANFAALPAALGGSVDKATLTARQAPVNSPQLVNRVLTSLRGDGAKDTADEAERPAVVDEVDEVDSSARPVSLAEAMVSAPDTAVELTGEPVAAAVPAISDAPDSNITVATVTDTNITDSNIAVATVTDTNITDSNITVATVTGSIVTVGAGTSAVGTASASFSETSAPLPVAEHGVPDLLAPTKKRPRLSDAIKATLPDAVPGEEGKRSRRKKR